MELYNQTHKLRFPAITPKLTAIIKNSSHTHFTHRGYDNTFLDLIANLPMSQGYAESHVIQRLALKPAYQIIQTRSSSVVLTGLILLLRNC